LKLDLNNTIIDKHILTSKKSKNARPKNNQVVFDVAAILRIFITINSDVVEVLN